MNTKLWLISLILLLTAGCTMPMIRPPETSAQGESVGYWISSPMPTNPLWDAGFTVFGQYPIEDISLMEKAAQELGWSYSVRPLETGCFQGSCPLQYTEEEKENNRIFALEIPLAPNRGNLFVRDASAFWRKYEELKVRQAVQAYPDDVLTWETTTSFEYLGIFNSEETQRFRGAAEKLDWTYILFRPDALVEDYMFFLSLPPDLYKQDALNLFQQTARDLKGPQN